MSQTEKKVDVVKLLDEYHNDKHTQLLVEKFNSPTIFDIIKKNTAESIHSNFLKWLFGLEDYGVQRHMWPIYGLLRAILRNGIKQNKISEDLKKDLQKVLYIEYEALEIVDIQTEVICPGVQIETHKKKSEGRADIVIDLKLSLKGKEERFFTVVIENKVTTTEHDKQTWKYYTYFTGDTGNAPEEVNVSDSYKKPGAHDNYIFVYLTPEFYSYEIKDICDYFITLTYQDIMTYIITPILSYKNLNFRFRFFIEEYAKSLSIPYILNDKYTFMSLDKEDAELLIEFWNKNEELLKLALEALAQSSEEEVKENAKSIITGINNIKKTRKTYNLTIKGVLKIPAGLMKDICKGVVEYLLVTKQEDMKKIESLLADLRPKPVIKKAETEIDPNEGDSHSRYDPVPIIWNNKYYYLNKEWKFDVFKTFIKKVEDNYPNEIKITLL